MSRDECRGSRAKKQARTQYRPALDFRPSTLGQFGHEFHGFTQIYFADHDSPLSPALRFWICCVHFVLAGRNKSPTQPTRHMSPIGPSLAQGFGVTKAITTRKMPTSSRMIPNTRYDLFLVILIRCKISSMLANERQFPRLAVAFCGHVFARLTSLAA